MKNLFQNLSNSNQRIVIVSLSISSILLCLSVFILTISKSFADPNLYDLSKSPKIGVGIQGSYVYYFGEDHRLYRMPANKALEYEK